MTEDATCGLESGETVCGAESAAMAAPKKGFSAAVLKWTALLTMLIDHTAATVVEQVLMPASGSETWWTVYLVMRYIGRLAFPLYCFLLVEGFIHTRSRAKYALRLGLFALLSETPFDRAFYGVALEYSHQNVFFTLLLGLLSVWAAEALRRRFADRRWLGAALAGIAMLACAMAAGFLRTDYGFCGVLLIAALHLLRKWELPKYLAAAVLLFLSSDMEIAAYPAFYLMHRCDGRRGGGNSPAARLLFYVVYPAHLLLLSLIVRALV